MLMKLEATCAAEYEGVRPFKHSDLVIPAAVIWRSTVVELVTDVLDNTHRPYLHEFAAFYDGATANACHMWPPKFSSVDQAAHASLSLLAKTISLHMGLQELRILIYVSTSYDQLRRGKCLT